MVRQVMARSCHYGHYGHYGLLGRPLIIVSSSVAIYNVILYEGIDWLDVNLSNLRNDAMT